MYQARLFSLRPNLISCPTVARTRHIDLCGILIMAALPISLCNAAVPNSHSLDGTSRVIDSVSVWKNREYQPSYLFECRVSDEGRLALLKTPNPAFKPNAPKNLVTSLLVEDLNTGKFVDWTNEANLFQDSPRPFDLIFSHSGELIVAWPILDELRGVKLAASGQRVSYLMLSNQGARNFRSFSLINATAETVDLFWVDCRRKKFNFDCLSRPYFRRWSRSDPSSYSRIGKSRGNFTVVGASARAGYEGHTYAIWEQKSYGDDRSRQLYFAVRSDEHWSKPIQVASEAPRAVSEDESPDFSYPAFHSFYQVLPIASNTLWIVWLRRSDHTLLGRFVKNGDIGEEEVIRDEVSFATMTATLGSTHVLFEGPDPFEGTNAYDRPPSRHQRQVLHTSWTDNGWQEPTLLLHSAFSWSTQIHIDQSSRMHVCWLELGDGMAHLMHLARPIAASAPESNSTPVDQQLLDDTGTQPNSRLKQPAKAVTALATARGESGTGLGSARSAPASAAAYPGR
jgi:hypothetical protein